MCSLITLFNLTSILKYLTLYQAFEVIWTDMGLVRVRINPLMKTVYFVSPPKNKFATIYASRSQEE